MARKKKQPVKTAPGRQACRIPAKFWVLLLPFAQLVFFWNIIVQRRFFQADVVEQYYPSLSFLANSLRQFRLPYWSPYVFSGVPFLGDIQTQTFYPPCWLLAFFVGADGRLSFYAVELLIVVHLLVAGLLMYGLMREFRFTTESSVFAGLSFMLSGSLVLRTFHVTAVCTLAWLPLVLLFLHRSLHRRSLSDAVWGGLVFGLAALAGHPQFLLYVALSLAFYCLAFAARRWREMGVEAVWRPVLSLMLIGIIGVALAAVQYLPSLEFVRHTERASMNYADIVGASLRPSQLVTLLAPKFFGSFGGSVAEATDTVQFWGGEQPYCYWETAIYIGVMPLVMAVLGIGDRKRPLRWYGVLLAAVGLILALGRYTPAFRVALAVVPGLNRFRIPGRFGILFTTGIVILAAIGMESFLRKGDGSKWRKLLVGTGIATGVSALVWLLFQAGVLRGVAQEFSKPEVYRNSMNQWGVFLGFLASALGIVVYRATKRFQPGVGFGLICALVIADLSVFGSKFNAESINPDEAGFARSAELIQLQRESRQEAFRINTRGPGYMMLFRNQGNLDRVELIEGFTPLGLTRYAAFAVPTPPMLDLLNVKYGIDSTGSSFVLNPTYLPRARMVYRYELAKSASEALRIVRAGIGDYRYVALVEQDPGFASHAVDSVPNVVSITRRDPNRMELAVQTDSTGLLMLSEVYYPEWKATLDGRPATIYPVDYGLRGITVPAGEHRVAMYFDAGRVKAGGTISLLMLFVAVLALVVLGRKPAGPVEAKPESDR